MADYPPFMNAYGNVTKILNKIKDAKTPERFSQDYLGTVLGFTGGSATPFIPLAKRLGLISSDGAPTPLYGQFRNDATSQQAMAQAIRNGYPELYKRNEFVHALDAKGLQGLIMETTGLSKESKTIGAIVGTFNALKAFANFELDEITAVETTTPVSEDDPQRKSMPEAPPRNSTSGSGFPLGLSYTINLNLPDTSDQAVFNAIFKSLKENLLQ
ncbi:MAG: DUF5343 domain-containing protein [Candidatus Planktophila sp.]|nr:DUF5343 domain-containing protein [Candidatus Planktophila sp.]